MRLNPFQLQTYLYTKTDAGETDFKKTTIHFSEADWGDEAQPQATGKLKTKLAILSVSKEKD